MTVSSFCAKTSTSSSGWGKSWSVLPMIASRLTPVRRHFATFTYMQRCLRPFTKIASPIELRIACRTPLRFELARSLSGRRRYSLARRPRPAAGRGPVEGSRSKSQELRKVRPVPFLQLTRSRKTTAMFDCCERCRRKHHSTHSAGAAAQLPLARRPLRERRQRYGVLLRCFSNPITNSPCATQ